MLSSELTYLPPLGRTKKRAPYAVPARSMKRFSFSVYAQFIFEEHCLHLLSSQPRFASCVRIIELLHVLLQRLRGIRTTKHSSAPYFAGVLSKLHFGQFANLFDADGSRHTVCLRGRYTMPGEAAGRKRGDPWRIKSVLS